MVGVQWKTYFTVQFPQVHHNKCVQCSPSASLIVAAIVGAKVKRHGGFSLGASHLPEESDTYQLKTQQTVHSKVTDKR